MIRTLLIDNYDSFTFNLYHYLAEVNGIPPVVVPNDWIDWHAGALDGYDNVMISPGPGSPDKIADFGICAEVIATATIPILGICLGHQGIALAHGGSVAHAPSPRHGRLSEIRNFGVDLFSGIPPTFDAVRYHSLAVTDVPKELEVTAYSDDGVIMGLRHRTLPQWGVQFHPESISTEHSLALLSNFARLTREWAGGASTEHDRTGADSTTSDQPIRSTRSVAPTGEKAITDEVSNLVALHVEVLDQSASSEQIFASLYGHEEESVWLDGNRPGSQSSRFSVMGAPTGPNGRVVTADTNTGTIRIRRTDCHLPSPTGQVTTIKSDFFDWLEGELDRIDVESPPLPFDFCLGWVGYMGYELKTEVGSTNRHESSLPDATMMFLDRAVVFDHVASKVYLLALLGLGESLADCEDWCAQTRAALRTIDAAASTTEPAPVTDPARTFSSKGSTLTARHRRDEYRELIERALEKITDGETYEVCLTNMIEVDAEFEALSVYLALRADNPTPFGAYLKCREATVLSTSPERFVRITADGRIESKPIKGTRARGASESEDAAIRDELLHSEKDRSENLMIVDLVRHDLGATAQVGSVSVDELFGIESYATVHQMVSTVSALLDPEQSPVACVRAAFPPGSMTGAPKLRTMSIIDELEGGPRGVYSGGIGYFSLNGAVDLSVVIRTLVITDGTLRCGVGGAIVALSDPEDEYAETVAKAAPLLRLFGNVEFPETNLGKAEGEETLLDADRGSSMK
ncbi:aminodeoxychorismate synthase component I [Brevibacterium aurantiacum]|uniref:aminodeoxychorismate synthase component I n=1 Tax=Brevibacterium aurantiacum TaxID=273384 RepID=UPI00299F8643|nr:aminodeoxychorismate synthase component I [Brevibacterium aurantiacum]